MDLGDLIASLLDELEDVGVLADREYARDRVAFAARTGDAAIELRLGPEIAEAALRTPDTGRSGRGTEWIHFAPREWDEHAADRLEAWFRVAWRRAGGGR